jgi:hypothetical protein
VTVSFLRRTVLHGVSKNNPVGDFGEINEFIFHSTGGCVVFIGFMSSKSPACSIGQNPS